MAYSTGGSTQTKPGDPRGLPGCAPCRHITDMAGYSSPARRADSGKQTALARDEYDEHELVARLLSVRPQAGEASSKGLSRRVGAFEGETTTRLRTMSSGRWGNQFRFRRRTREHLAATPTGLHFTPIPPAPEPRSPTQLASLC